MEFILVQLIFSPKYTVILSKVILELLLYLFSYQKLMKESSRMPLFDLRKLNASLPVPPVPKSSIEVLVLGAKDDFIVVIL